MPQRYKLRLGDGTFLSVDQDGLKTWLHDARAVVQSVGSQQWRPLQQVLAEEESAARLMRALVPPQPRQEATPPPPVAPPSQPVDQPTFSEPAVSGLAFGEPAFSEPPVAVAARPGLQALADDPVSSGSAGARTAPEPDHDMPIIRMKPLDDEPVYPAAWSAKRGEDAYEDEDELAEDEPRHDRLDGPLLTVLERFGGFLSRCLDPLTPLVARFSSRKPEASTPSRVEAATRGVPREAAVSTGAAPTVLALVEEPALVRGLEHDAGRGAAGRPTLYARVSEWTHGLTARLGRGALLQRPEPAAPKREPATPLPRTPASRQPLAAPTPISELPVLRFVETHEPREAVDVYEGEELSFSLQPVWLWTKRVVVIGGLGAALAYAVLERDAWFPKAADLGQTVFTEIDRQARSRERTQQQQQALENATARLPQLAPETILLLFTGSPTGVFDPPELFQLAAEAAERGETALTPSEAEELRALQRELLANLRPTQRERVLEYQRTRQRRVIFPFEYPPVMELLARGAQALPAASRERLQSLNGKAVAAGLGLPTSSSAPSATR